MPGAALLKCGVGRALTPFFPTSANIAFGGGTNCLGRCAISLATLSARASSIEVEREVIGTLSTQRFQSR